MKISRIHVCSRCDEAFEIEPFLIRLLEEEEAEIESIICYDCLAEIFFSEEGISDVIH
jgi:uncharacterized CHY-type Zn-finger protein